MTKGDTGILTKTEYGVPEVAADFSICFKSNFAQVLSVSDLFAKEEHQ